nr:unnamed protein product [Callosobruchus analis]
MINKSIKQHFPNLQAAFAQMRQKRLSSSAAYLQGKQMTKIGAATMKGSFKALFDGTTDSNALTTNLHSTRIPPSWAHAPGHSHWRKQPDRFWPNGNHWRDLSVAWQISIGKFLTTNKCCFVAQLSNSHYCQMSTFIKARHTFVM